MSNRNMLVETVYERRGFRFEPVITKPDNTAVDNAKAAYNSAMAAAAKAADVYAYAKAVYDSAKVQQDTTAKTYFGSSTFDINRTVYYIAYTRAIQASVQAAVNYRAATDNHRKASAAVDDAAAAYSAANKAVEDKDNEEVTYRKVPVLIPVGVLVGINDAVNGVGCIRIGWSRCRLPPSNKPVEIPDEYLKLMTQEGISKYHDDRIAYKKAVENSDEFNMERGIAQAIQNMTTMAIADTAANIPTGRGFRRKYDTFRTRCYRYFKDVRDVVENGKVVTNPCWVSAVQQKQQAKCNCPLCIHKKNIKEIFYVK